MRRRDRVDDDQEVPSVCTPAFAVMVYAGEALLLVASKIRNHFGNFFRQMEQVWQDSPATCVPNF